MGKSSCLKFFPVLFLFSLFFLFISSFSYGIDLQDTTKNKQVKKADSVTVEKQANTDTTKQTKADTIKRPTAKDSTLKKPQAALPDTTLKLTQHQKDSVLNAPRTYSSEDLNRGERLFYGLAYPKDIAVNCASCHNTQILDTLNWNPDALEISQKYLQKTPSDLSKILLNPLGKKMSQVHKDFHLKAEDIVLLKGFMNQFVNIGLKADKPIITNLLLLIISSILFLLAFTDLIIKKIFGKRWIRMGILTVTFVVITWILAVNAINFGRAKGYSPDQPIKFSHAVHAGQNQINCIYCHYSAKLSKDPGIPPVGLCMNCHLLVRTGTRSGVTEINKIVYAYENKIAIDWIRIYRLPDFVFFSHAQHVNAGNIDCSACHGNVKEMHRLTQVPTLGMGWCLDCHDTRKVNISNEYYRTYYPTFYDSLKAGKVDSIRVTGIGGRDCGKCHY